MEEIEARATPKSPRRAPGWFGLTSILLALASVIASIVTPEASSDIMLLWLGGAAVACLGLWKDRDKRLAGLSLTLSVTLFACIIFAAIFIADCTKHGGQC